MDPSESLKLEPTSMVQQDEVVIGSRHATSDKDIALGLVGEHAHPIDSVIEARVLRKIDMFFMPAMIIGYGFCYYDKAILGNAVLFGMTTDLSLSVTDNSTRPPVVNTSRLSWATSLFYFGMLAGLYPMTFALQRLNVGRVLGGIVIVWSSICMATAGVKTWQGLYVQRFFLGSVESVMPTAYMSIVSGYYTQQEQALRQSIWLSSTGLFTIIGGSLNYGFAQIHGGSLRPWQYIYLFAGVLTFLFGLCCFAVPDSPVSAWFLSKEERIVAVERLRKGQTGVRCQKVKLSQALEALLDIKTWLLTIMMAAAYTINGAITGFGPLIVSTFGWTTLDSILLQFPTAAICSLSLLLAGWLSARYTNIRIILLVASCLPIIAGCAIIWRSTWSHRAAAPVVGYALIGFFGVPVTQTFSLSMSNVAGATKKSVTAATVWVGYVVGNIVGPQMVRSQSRSRHYPELWLGLIICYCLVILCAVALYLVLWRANQRKINASRVSEEERDKLAFQDLTDKENPYFRYVL